MWVTTTEVSDLTRSSYGHDSITSDKYRTRCLSTRLWHMCGIWQNLGKPTGFRDPSKVRRLHTTISKQPCRTFASDSVQYHSPAFNHFSRFTTLFVAAVIFVHTLQCSHVPLLATISFGELSHRCCQGCGSQARAVNTLSLVILLYARCPYFHIHKARLLYHLINYSRGTTSALVVFTVSWWLPRTSHTFLEPLPWAKGKG